MFSRLKTSQGRELIRRTVVLMWPFLCALLLMGAIAVAGTIFIAGLRAYSNAQQVMESSFNQAIFSISQYAHHADAESLRTFNAQQAKFVKLHEMRLRLLERNLEYPEFEQRWLDIGMHPSNILPAWRVQHYAGFTPEYKQLMDVWAISEQATDRMPSLMQRLQQAWKNPPDQTDRLRLMHELRDIEKQTIEVSQHLANLIATQSNLSYTIVMGIAPSILILVILGLTWRSALLIAQRYRVEESFRMERQQAHVTLAAISDAVIRTDEQGLIQFMNAAALRMLGLRNQPGPVTLDSILQLSPDGLAATLSTNDFLQFARQGKYAKGTNTQPNLILANGQHLAIAWEIAQVDHDEDSSEHGLVLVLRDTTQERRMIESLSWLAAHDPLTGLPNRREFERQMGLILDQLDNNPNSQGSVLLYIDLDQFKIVNDTCGHTAGDELLRLVAKRVSDCCQERVLFARMGGDEFSILLPDATLNEGLNLAQRVSEAVTSCELVWGARQFSVSASIGVVHLQGGGQNLSSVMSCADVACYSAKEKGRNRVEIYRTDDHAMASRLNEMEWVQRLQLALREDHFVLLRQRILDLQPAHPNQPQPDHYELLLRLGDEHGQLIAPGHFIPAAERFGLMTHIDRWVIRTALHMLADIYLHADNASPDPLYAINLSGASIDSDGFEEDLKLLFEETQVPFHWVCFEITETHAVKNIEKASRFITCMRQLGCKFALDDFGAGMSSFSYLKNLPVDCLKIDGSLVKDMLTDKADFAMVKMINDLGHTMNMTCVAEFVEDDATLKLLQQLNVDYAQGYGIGRPEEIPLPPPLLVVTADPVVSQFARV